MSGLLEKASEIKEKCQGASWLLLHSLNYSQPDLHAVALFEVISVSILCVRLSVSHYKIVKSISRASLWAIDRMLSIQKASPIVQWLHLMTGS